MYLSRNYEELFINPDNESEKWDETFFKILKEGKPEEVTRFLRTVNYIFIEDNKISVLINEFTKKTRNYKLMEKLIKGLKKYDDYVTGVTLNNSNIIIETTKGMVKAMPLSTVSKSLRTIYPELETNKRNGQCHVKSLEISKMLHIPHEVVTGYVYGLSDKSKYLHSWIEIKDKSAVVDYTMNAIINKDGYYLVKHAEPLSRINNKDIIEDEKFLQKFSRLEITFSYKEYLVFRDEIMRDIQKNSHLFADER